MIPRPVYSERRSLRKHQARARYEDFSCFSSPTCPLTPRQDGSRKPRTDWRKLPSGAVGKPPGRRIPEGMSTCMKKGFVWFGLIVAVSIWGSLYVASKFILAQMSPFVLLFLRFAIASTILLPLAARGLSRDAEKELESCSSSACELSMLSARQGRSGTTAEDDGCRNAASSECPSAAPCASTGNHAAPYTAARRFPLPARKDLPLVLYVGFMGYFVSNGLLLLGIRLSSASTASLINAMNPVFITLFAFLLLKEPMGFRKAASIACAVAGAIVIIGASGGTGGWIGVTVSLLSMATWSLTVIAIRKLTKRYQPLLVTAWGMGISAVCSLPVAIVTLLTGAPAAGTLSAALPAAGNLSAAMPAAGSFPASMLNIGLQSGSWTPLLILAILYVGFVCTALSHVLWNKCLSMLDAGTCAVFYPIQPVVSVLLGWMLLGERLTPRFALGCLLIVAGVLANVMPARNRTNAAAHGKQEAAPVQRSVMPTTHGKRSAKETSPVQCSVMPAAHGKRSMNASSHATHGTAEPRGKRKKLHEGRHSLAGRFFL